VCEKERGGGGGEEENYMNEAKREKLRIFRELYHKHEVTAPVEST
jgi:hypothetical protein